jgi:ATP-binding cassette, subfamily B, bacterial
MIGGLRGHGMEENGGKDGAGRKSKLKRFLDAAGKAFKTLAGSPRVVKLIWKAHPLYTVAMVFVSLVMAVLPIANLWVAKLIVDAVTGSVGKFGLAGLKLESISGLFSAAQLVPLLLAMAALELSQSLLQPVARYIEEQLGDLLSRDVAELILRKANSLVDVSFFESSEFYDNLQKAQNEAGYKPVHMLNVMLTIARAGVTFLVMLASFLVFQPFISLVVILFSVPNFILQFKHNRESWALYQWETPEVRKMYYYRQVITSKEYACETRMFNLGGYFLTRYLRIFNEFYANHAKIRGKRLRQNMLFSCLGNLADIFAYAFLAISTVAGRISIGSFYFYSNALSQIQSQLWNLVWSVSSLYEDNLFLDDLFKFLDTKPTMVLADPTWALAAPRPIRHGIEFRNVSFRYPGADQNVLSGLNFKLSPDETIALVGENGAGKTTIVKLIGRLYDPSEGEILVDGVNLKDFDLESWRGQMSVIFQDFVNYHLTAGENIGVGQVNFIDDEIRIKAAAQRGGAAAVIEKLPKKYETMLVKGWGGHKDKDEAHDLSGGEWQKMALSRAFMRAPQSEINAFDEKIEKHLKNGAAQLLVLDEPTASLDVQSEHDIYLRFQELTRGKTTVLISHRFSTVRMADRILLLEQGKIAEEGSHEELMALAGAYAGLYKLQADRYT